MNTQAQVSTALRIAILDDTQDAVRHLDAFRKLAGHTVSIHTRSESDPAALAAQIGNVDVLIPIRERTVINDGLLSMLPSLRLISQTGKGVSHIDTTACTRRGIAVAASGGNPYAPAELTWALVLAAMRRLPGEVENAQRGKWQAGTLGTQLRGRVLGILGYGTIGAIVARYGAAFGMRVIVWGRDGSLARATSDGFEVATSREAFFSESDVLSVHLRLTDDTRGCIRAGDLALMKSSSVFVNSSRADLVEPSALLAQLRRGNPGFAALDAYEVEPAYAEPLFALPNTICSPHLGYVEKDTYEIFFGGAFDNVLAFAAGQPTNLVNPDVITSRT